MISIKVPIAVTLEGTRACDWGKDSRGASEKTDRVQFVDLVAVTNTLAL